MFIKTMPKIFRTPDADGGAGTSGSPVAAVAPWYDTLDSETKGYLQNKGLDKKTAVEAFVEVSKFHREAEKFVGAPANEIVRLPKDPNAPEWQNVYERLGKPKEAKEYDFTGVKHAGDKALDQALSDTLRQAAFEANLTKEQAQRYASGVVKYLDSEATAKAALAADKLSTEKTELKKNWGSNEAANMVIAQSAARALGVKPEAVAALEGIIGYAQVMEMFRTIGTKIGEDRFVTSSNSGGGNLMTRDQALAEKKALMADEAWTKRYLNRGVEEMRKMTALERIIVGVA